MEVTIHLIKSFYDFCRMCDGLVFNFDFLLSILAHTTVFCSKKANLVIRESQNFIVLKIPIENLYKAAV